MMKVWGLTVGQLGAWKLLQWLPADSAGEPWLLALWLIDQQTLCHHAINLGCHNVGPVQASSSWEPGTSILKVQSTVVFWQDSE